MFLKSLSMTNNKIIFILLKMPLSITRVTRKVLVSRAPEIDTTSAVIEKTIAK